MTPSDVIARRREVLSETIDAFRRSRGEFERLAGRNLDRWRRAAREDDSDLTVLVYREDWGDVARALCQRHGRLFAVLNMASAVVPGGGYLDGAGAQEENLFRRTDCHFSIEPADVESGLYRPHLTSLLSAQDGTVYLDAHRPRICIRGPEDLTRRDLGYDWLDHDAVFPFLELRASADDLRDGSTFDPADARRRISAQLETLRRHGVRHVVLGAFGCGSFLNPAEQVAAIYREEIARRRQAFSVVAFAVLDTLRGPDNFTVFHEAMVGM